VAHPLFRALKNLDGNARGVVVTEPLWGIPFNLYAPYVSVYMRSLGLLDGQIGLLLTISLLGQIISSVFSGIITDKLGRKKTTFIFDALAWSVPCLIWAVAQDFTYFLVAAVINSIWRITMNSWTCLLVEDTDPNKLMDIYSWIYISGLLTAFFAPIAGLLIHQFSLVPTMRGLYILAAVLMTVKFYATNVMVKETRQGLIRMEETRHQNVLTMLGEYRNVFLQILKSPRTLYTMGIMLVLGSAMMIYNTFWSIFATEKLSIPTQDLAYYSFARSVIMLIFFFLVMPRIREMHFKQPMLIGFAGLILCQVVLVIAPIRGYLALLLVTFLEACSYAAVSTQTDRMIVVSVDARERSRIMAIIYVIVISFTSPFGWIGGLLSQVNRILPFVLNMILFAIGGFLVYQAAKLPDGDIAAAPLADDSTFMLSQD
jgi:DHA1 family tetracycline resistance protein-like MFS transporter